MSGTRRLFAASAGVFVLVFGAAAAMGAEGWRINLTPSVPGIIFREVTAPVTVGSYVAFCLPWTSAELPMSKKTDVPVCTADHPHRFTLIKIVRKIESDGRLLVMGTDPHSYDSRYYGPIPVSAVRSVMRRVW